jgi:GT2 family glycosyltransferase
VDDGSTDNTQRVAAQFTEKRVRYIYQENRGLSAARNTGIHAARGRFLAFLDADDEWEPSFLAVCLRQLIAKEAIAAVAAMARFIDENGAVLPRVGGQVVGSLGFRSRLLEGGFFPPSAVLIRAEAVRRAGLFDVTLTSLEDWDLWLRVTASGEMMKCIPEPLARYRVSAGSMSTNASRMHFNRMAVLTKHIGAAEGDPTVWPTEKRRAYACAYRIAALDYLQQREPQTAWYWLREAAQVWPPILTRLDTFYELACGDQPRGNRGEARSLEIEPNGAEMLRELGVLFAGASPGLQALRPLAFGNAYLALGMLSDQAGNWAAARHYLLRAIRHNPQLISGSFVRRMGKVTAGKHVVGFLKGLRDRVEVADGFCSDTVLEKTSD